MPRQPVRLPNRLPVLRAERRLSQIEIAARCGIGHNRYWRIENGYADPTPAERSTLARFLSVSIPDIWEASAFPNSPQTAVRKASR